ncbi:hypothetical protein BC939DRAFT_504837 [Gamsiella multidivaricata]|uniref:uncharacterized protein n=1 Tax=Gamsiella multidivaricata TaxID=101098 RepID=UPI00221EAEBD|nr:uncharacterized protein BC939DRAFT_504837 [Gamsiella multidivaricata]KAI7820617.1 hypothetical protein BC939DRAFT_504837 [Gamsiella multidivaricata]
MAPTLERTETDSLYCNPTEDGGSIKAPPSIKSVKSTTSSTSSTKSGSQSTKSRSTTKSKSSTSSIPKSANWKAATDPLGMSSKAVGPGFMPMFSTHLYSPGFQVPTAQAAVAANPKAYQSRQLKFVEKKRTGSSAASTKSGKSEKSGKSGKSGKSEKTGPSSSDKSVKSSSSSTKSTFLSSFTGSFSTQGDSESSMDKKIPETIEETEPPKIEEATKETEVPKEPESGSNPSDSKPSSTPLTGELTVVVEDHSSHNNSVHPFDNPASSPIAALRRPSIAESLRRPSIAESISNLQLPTQQLQHTPNELLLRRVTIWEYIGRVHQGKIAYYNTIMLTEADLRKYYTPDHFQKRAHQYFFLGTSIANVLDIPRLSDYAKSLSMVLQEYEHYLSLESKSKKNFFRGGKKLSDGRSFEETEEYAHFEIRTVPFEMDYIIIFATLCDMISIAYKKFDTHKANAVIDSDVFHKIDVRLKKILNTATKELENLTREAIHEELKSLDPLASFIMEWDQ